MDYTTILNVRVELSVRPVREFKAAFLLEDSLKSYPACPLYKIMKLRNF